MDDHHFNLDQHRWKYQAFTDLNTHLVRSRVPDERIGSGTRLVDQVGHWAGHNVLRRHLGGGR